MGLLLQIRACETIPSSRILACLIFLVMAVRNLASLQTITIGGSGMAAVNGLYISTPATEVPRGFDLVCRQQGWDTSQMWSRLGGGKPWFKAKNEAYIYWNHGDGHWWIDHPNGDGVYKAAGPEHTPPQSGWKLLGNYAPPPSEVTLERSSAPRNDL